MLWLLVMVSNSMYFKCTMKLMKLVYKAWTAVVIYMTLKFADGPSGIGWLEKWSYRPLFRHLDYAVYTSSINHVMDLSSDFHEGSSVENLATIIHQGTSINELFDEVCFNVLPRVIDLVLVSWYLYYLFGPYMALNMAVTMWVYLITAPWLAKRRNYLRVRQIACFYRQWNTSKQCLKYWRLAAVS